MKHRTGSGSRNPEQRSAKPHSRGHDPLFFVMLETAKLPNRSLVLVTEPGQEQARKLNYKPVAYCESANIAIGLTSIQGRHSISPGWSSEVWRGRKGGKPPEKLTVISRVPKQLESWPAARYKGLMKSVGAALECTCQAGAGNDFRAWSAIQLALDGTVSRSNTGRFGETDDFHSLGKVDCIVKSGDLLIWRGFVDRIVQRMMEKAAAAIKHNPLMQFVDERHVAGWLGVAARPVAAAVLTAYADESGLNTELDYQLRTMLETPGAEISEEISSITGAIMAEYAEGKGLTRTALMTRHKSYRHVVAWLFEAHLLIEGADGFVFTHDELVEACRRLKWSHANPAPSVRDIKDKLNAGRKKAEALRSLLEQYSAGKPTIAAGAAR